MFKHTHFVLLLLALLLFGSCEKEVLRYAEMEQYYEESIGLAQTSPDSISSFSRKVDAFVTLYPAAKEDPLYPEIKANIRQAWLNIRINGGVWGDDKNIGFEFGE